MIRGGAEVGGRGRGQRSGTVREQYCMCPMCSVCDCVCAAYAYVVYLCSELVLPPSSLLLSLHSALLTVLESPRLLPDLLLQLSYLRKVRNIIILSNIVKH